MEFEREVLVSPASEVPVIDGEVVTAVRTLFGRGVGRRQSRGSSSSPSIRSGATPVAGAGGVPEPTCAPRRAARVGARLSARRRVELLTAAVRQTVSQRGQDDWREASPPRSCTLAVCRDRRRTRRRQNALLAIALGRAVDEAGHSALFVSAAALLAALARAETEGQLADRLMFFSKPKLLIIDELGYLPFERHSAHLFFQLVARRDERGSLLITTNQLVTQWDAVFGDDVLAAAILDRLLHHSHTHDPRGELSTETEAQSRPTGHGSTTVTRAR